MILANANSGFHGRAYAATFSTQQFSKFLTDPNTLARMQQTQACRCLCKGVCKEIKQRM